MTSGARRWSGGWAVLVLAAAATAGCTSDCPPGDTSADTGGGDTGTEDSGGRQVLTGADCPMYSGFGVEGATWTYSGITSSLTFTQTVTRVQNGFVDLSTHTVQDGSDGSVTEADGRIRYRCATDGMWRLDSSSVTTVSSAKDTTVSHEVRVHDPSAYALALPAAVEADTAWDTHYLGLSSGQSGPERFDYVASNAASGIETVTVPAGTFSALHVVVTTNGTPRNEWRDAEVGVVLGDYLQLVAYTR